MKKINQYKLLAGICALSLFTACDFEELNTNPFEMTDEMGIRDGVAVGGAVTAMQRAVVTVGTQADDTDAINQYLSLIHIFFVFYLILVKPISKKLGTKAVTLTKLRFALGT